MDDGSGEKLFFSNTEEKSEDFVWKHLERMFLVNLAMSKIVAVYEEGQIECGTFCVNEKMAQIGPQLHNDQKLDLSLGRKSTEVYHYQLVVVGTGGTGSYYLKELGGDPFILNEGGTQLLCIVHNRWRPGGAEEP